MGLQRVGSNFAQAQRAKHSGRPQVVLALLGAAHALQRETRCLLERQFVVFFFLCALLRSSASFAPCQLLISACTLQLAAAAAAPCASACAQSAPPMSPESHQFDQCCLARGRRQSSNRRKAATECCGQNSQPGGDHGACRMPIRPNAAQALTQIARPSLAHLRRRADGPNFNRLAQRT